MELWVVNSDRFITGYRLVLATQVFVTWVDLVLTQNDC